jgi:hypothetical protein
MKAQGGPAVVASSSPIAAALPVMVIVVIWIFIGLPPSSIN